MIYCVDSNIIIWGIKRQATAGQEEMIPRAEQIFSKADELNDIILVPTIVVAEILVPESPETRAKYLEVFNKNFIVAPFDERAAMKYAEILHGRLKEVNELAAEMGTPRQKMKADHMIIATALVNGANCIYSTDGPLKTFASGLIDVRDVPPARPEAPIMAAQPSLFPATEEAVWDTEDDDEEQK